MLFEKINEDIKDAIDRTNNALNDTPDFLVKAVNESAILDYLPYMERSRQKSSE